jgi:hypothetical protein
LRILVDESLPRRLAAEFEEHSAATVRQQGWLGLSNGVLLRAAAAGGFQVMLTADRSLQFQQNLQSIGIAVIVLGGRNRLRDLRALVPEIRAVLQSIRPGDVVRIGN